MELLQIIMKEPSYSFFLITPPPHSHHPNHPPTPMTTCPSTSPVGLLELQFSSVQLLSHVWLFATPRTAACQASLCIASSQSLLKLMSIESVMPSNHLILCHPLLLLPSIFPSIRVFFCESELKCFLCLCSHPWGWMGTILSSPVWGNTDCRIYYRAFVPRQIPFLFIFKHLQLEYWNHWLVFLNKYLALCAVYLYALPHDAQKSSEI